MVLIIGTMSVIEAIDSLLRALSRRASPEQVREIERVQAALAPLRAETNQENNHDANKHGNSAAA